MSVICGIFLGRRRKCYWSAKTFNREVCFVKILLLELMRQNYLKERMTKSSFRAVSSYTKSPQS